MAPVDTPAESFALVSGPGAPVAYDIVGAAIASGMGRSPIIEAMDEGELPARKLGRRVVILHEDLMAWLRALPPREPGQCFRRPKGREARAASTIRGGTEAHAA